MRYRRAGTYISLSIMLSGILLAAPVAVWAQESAPAQSEEGSCPMCQKHMKKNPTGADNSAERHRRHDQMEAMHEEMTQKLQQQLTALREHAKLIDGVSDQTQLLTEMKKHQQMTDALLGTMIEHHQKMHTAMQEHHTHMQSTMSHEQQAPASTPQPEREE